MHFKTPVTNLPVDGVDKFLAEAGVASRPEIFAHRQEIEITSDNLASLPEILVLNYENI